MLLRQEQILYAACCNPQKAHDGGDGDGDDGGGNGGDGDLSRGMFRDTQMAE